MTRVFAVVLSCVFAAACGTPAGSGGVQPASNGPAAASPAGATQAASRTPSGAPVTGAPGTAGTAARAAFLSHVFTDVRDGKQFRLGDFQGKQVLVLGMAVW